LEAVQSLSQATSGQVDLPRLRNALRTSLGQFNDSATRAIKRLYAGPKREKGMYHDSDSDEDSEDEKEDGHATEDLDESTGPNETVFLVYLWVKSSRESADDSFLFTLEEFGREVLFLLDTIEEVSYMISEQDISSYI
jgi:hypothetical protein